MWVDPASVTHARGKRMRGRDRKRDEMRGGGGERWREGRRDGGTEGF